MPPLQVYSFPLMNIIASKHVLNFVFNVEGTVQWRGYFIACLLSLDLFVFAEILITRGNRDNSSTIFLILPHNSGVNSFLLE